jgi:hypothetical protein
LTAQAAVRDGGRPACPDEAGDVAQDAPMLGDVVQDQHFRTGEIT